MSGDVGTDDSVTGSAPPDSPVDAPDAGAIVLVDLSPPRGSSGALAPAQAVFDSARGVQAYLGSQLPPSRRTAADSLRRIARLVLRSQDADLSEVPWVAFGYEQATAIRTALYEMTRTGAITPGTANLTLTHLRGLIREMYRMGLVTSVQKDLTDKTGPLKSIRGKREARGRALSAPEERALREAARRLKGYQGGMLDTAIVLAVGAGLRREEIVQLAVEGLSPGSLQVVGKGNKARRIPVDAQMQDAIDTWLKERDRLAPKHGGLFCSPQRPDKTMSPWSFWALVRNAAHGSFGDRKPCDKECLCLKIVTGPHDFRRTFATRLLDQGIDISQTQQLMGHESIETTARYDKRDIEALFEKRRNMRIIA